MRAAMFQDALSSVPSGRRLAHLVLASTLLAAAGAAPAFAGPNDDDKKGQTSGLPRMQQRAMQSAPAHQEAPAPRAMPSERRSEPSQPMMVPRAEPAPRVITAPGAPGA